MKKLIFLVILIFSIALQAQTTQGYFTETTKPSTLLGTGSKYYAYGSTTADTATGAAYYVVSRAFGTSAGTRNNFMGTKFICGIQVTVAFADVAATLILQTSLDGTNWVDSDTLSTDTTPNVTGTYVYLADLTSVYSPYARLIFNKGGLTINTTGKLKFLYAIPAN